MSVRALVPRLLGCMSWAGGGGLVVGQGAGRGKEERDRTPPPVSMCVNTTLFLARLFFEASQFDFIYISSMDSWPPYIFEITVEARPVEFIWEDHTKLPDGSEDVSYSSDSFTVLIPKFSSCVRVAAFLAPHRWN